VLPPPGWRRVLFERVLAGAIARDVERALRRLKRAAETEVLASEA
jgi:hypothetical protein